MARRQQVQYQPPKQGIEPIAQPQSRPFVPRLPPDVMLPVDELAGLSQTLQQISTQQAEKDFDEKRQQGLDAAAAAPTDVIDALAAAHKDQDSVDARNRAVQEAMAKAVREGKIHVSQDPAVHVGFVQGAAHRLMAGYDAKLAEQMAAATATTDANGDPVVARNPDELIQEVWKQYADNPILKNYYGSKVAQQMKAQADDQFTSAAAQKLGENRVNDTINWSTNALTDKFFALGVSGEEPTAETWTSVRAWADELYLKTGGKADRKEIMLQAIKGAASRMDAADSGESGVSKGAELIRDLSNAPVGSTTAGKDAVLAPELEALIAHYEHAAKAKAENVAKEDANLDAKTVDTAEREYFAELDAAREAGSGAADPIAVMDKYMAKVREDKRFADRTGLASDHLQGVALNSSKKQGAISGAQLMRELEGGGDVAELSYSARILYTTGNLDEPSYRAFQKEAQSRTAIRPLVEDSTLSQARHRELNEAAEVPGIPQNLRGEIGVEVQTQNRGLVSTFNAREIQAAKGWLELPEEQRETAQREWLDANVPELVKALNENGQKFSTDRATALSEIQDTLAHSQSPEKILQEKGHLLSAEQREFFRAKAIDATDYEKLTLSPAYQGGESFVLERVAEVYKDHPNRTDVLEVARRELKDMFVDTVGEKLAAAEPAKQTAAVRLTVQELADGVLERVATTRIARLQEAAKPGEEGVESANALLDFGAADRDAALTAIKITDRSQLADALVTQNQNVPESIASYQSAFLRATTAPSIGSQLPFLGLFQRVERVDVENLAESEGRRILADTKLSDKEKGQTVVDMFKVTGLRAEDLLADKVVLRPSPAWRGKVEGHIKRLSGSSDPRSQAQVVLMQKALETPPPEVNVKGVNIGPYTTPFFESEAELRVWADTRKGDLQSLARKYGVGDGEDAFKEFIRMQAEAIKRLNQE